MCEIVANLYYAKIAKKNCMQALEKKIQNVSQSTAHK